LSTKREAAYFSPQLFRFLRELARNNDREWFARNKPRYEKSVFHPSLKFIKDVRPRLKTISPYLVADPKPFGGSLFRIYRDIRFSKDKSPYKTNVAMEFWHKKGGKKQYGAGLYLHLAPGERFAGGGVWHPEPSMLARVREAIVSGPEDWRKVMESGLKVEGDSLKRPPVGFDPSHEFVKDLMLKDFTAGVRFRDSHVTSPNFMEEFVQAGKKLNPLNRFLSKALGLPW
jgi:uncharacterized protein (TIGR02453 family)